MSKIDELLATRKRLAFVKANSKDNSRVPYRWFVMDVELLLTRLEQAEQAAAHFFHCRQCTEDSEPCPEGRVFIEALGLGE